MSKEAPLPLLNGKFIGVVLDDVVELGLVVLGAGEGGALNPTTDEPYKGKRT